MADNPFATLMTPDRLEAQRDAEFEQKYAEANPWLRMAAEAGHKMAKAERAAGRGLTRDDIVAKRNENIMSGAQSKYAELLKSGKMAADEAQAEVLQEAIAGFAANGSWEQALALTQPLNALRKQSLERRKLKAEAEFQETRPDIEIQKADAATTRAEAQAQLADLRVAVAQAKTEAEVAKIRAETARLEALVAKLDREGKSEAEGGGKDDSVFGKKQRVETNENVMAAASAVRLMTGIREIGLENPAALTAAGPIMTQIATISEGSKALMMQSGYDPEKEASRFNAIVRQNVADQKLQSLTLDLAFAFARTRDPGGRLSNQDVEKAIEIVSGRGSPQSRMRVLEQSLGNLDKSIRAVKKVKDSEGYGPTPEAWELYEEALTGWNDAGKPAAPTKSTKPTVAGPPRGLTPEQFREWKKQNPNWKP